MSATLRFCVHMWGNVELIQQFILIPFFLGAELEGKKRASKE